jgi:phage terminase Nu1 subunit (DNA packaging protein)
VSLVRVNIQELADILGVTRPTITAWIDDGLPYAEAGSKGKPWKFETEDAVKWWAEHKFRRPRKATVPGGDPFEDSDGVESMEAAERRKMIAAADKAELELAKSAGLVVEIAEVATAVAEMHSRVRARLLSIGNQVRVRARAFLAGDREAEEQIVTSVESVISEAMEQIRDDVFAPGGEGDGGDGA